MHNLQLIHWRARDQDGPHKTHELDGRAAAALAMLASQSSHRRLQHV